MILMNIQLTSIKKSSIHVQTSPWSRVPTQGSWKVWLKAVWTMFVAEGLSSRKGTHNHCKYVNMEIIQMNTSAQQVSYFVNVTI